LNSRIEFNSILVVRNGDGPLGVKPNDMRCLLYIFLVGFLPMPLTAMEQPVAEGNELTIATFNINWGNVNLTETVKAIRQTKADVIALQEVNSEAEKHLRNELGQVYPHVSIRTGEGAAGFGFLSKHPFASVTYLEPKFGFLGTYLATVSVGKRRLQLVNVHLEPDIPRESDGPLQLLKRFRKLEATHLKEIRRIAGRFAKDMLVVVLGDFNSLSAGTAPTFLKERGFTDSAEQAHGEGKAPLSWHWRFNGVDLRYRLDYIFLPAGLKTIENKVIKTSSSDHLPVVTRMEWVPAKERKAGQ